MALVVDWGAIAEVHIEQTTTRYVGGEPELVGTGVCAKCARAFPCGPANMARRVELDRALRERFAAGDRDER